MNYHCAAANTPITSVTDFTNQASSLSPIFTSVSCCFFPCHKSNDPSPPDRRSSVREQGFIRLGKQVFDTVNFIRWVPRTPETLPHRVLLKAEIDDENIREKISSFL